MSVLGVSVSGGTVCALLRRGRTVVWAGTAEYDDLDDLAEVIARLASEAPIHPTRARVVLERDVVQLRTIAPAPRLSRAAAHRYVALEARRLFRRNGALLVTDGVMVRVDGVGGAGGGAERQSGRAAEAAGAAAGECGRRGEEYGASVLRSSRHTP